MREERNKKTVYRKLKANNITTHIKYCNIFWNKETGEKGWHFELTDGRKGKIVLGNEQIIFV